MRILVHAPSLKFSGAQHIAQSVIRQLGERTDVARVHAVVPAGRGYEHLSSDKISLHCVPRWLQKSFMIGFWNWILRRLVARTRPDAVLNLVNIAVPRVDNQFVLLHWPHALHMSAEVARRLPAKDYVLTRMKLALFRLRLHHARRYFVQTSAAREALLAAYGVEAKIMANAPDIRFEAPATPIERLHPRRRVLVFSHYYAHKNLEIVEELARRVVDRGLPYVFVLTVDPSASRLGAAFLHRLRGAIEKGVVENKGLVRSVEIPNLYASSDILLLPSLLESYSTAYVEAMHFGVPIVTSDRGFARSVCGEAALYVDPLSADDIMGALEALSASEDLTAGLIASGHEIESAQPNWRDIVERLLGDIIEDLGRPAKIGVRI